MHNSQGALYKVPMTMIKNGGISAVFYFFEEGGGLDFEGNCNTMMA